MKLTLAIIVCIGFYNAIAKPPVKSVDDEYSKFFEKAEKYALPLEKDSTFITYMLRWCKSEFADQTFKSGCIEAFKKKSKGKTIGFINENSKNQAAYDTLTEQISKLFFRVDRTSQPKRITPDAVDEEATICPICFHPVTSDGDHIIAATRCGHLFGDSCIRKWIDGERTPKSCPVCLKPVHKDNIQKLFNTKIVVVDNKIELERDQLKEELTELKNGIEMLKKSSYGGRQCSFGNSSK